MDRLPPFDELKGLREELDGVFAGGQDERKRKKPYIIDEILDLLIMDYIFGNESGNEMLYGPTETEDGKIKRTVQIDVDDMNKAVFRVIAGKNWEQRISEYLDDENGTVDEIIRVVDTDMTRIYNDAILDVGEKSDGPVMKTWQTMLDDRVRDTHDYLQSMTVPVDSRFYTFDGDSARYPGDFVLPENNINCRCRISLSMA